MFSRHHPLGRHGGDDPGTPLLGEIGDRRPLAAAASAHQHHRFGRLVQDGDGTIQILLRLGGMGREVGFWRSDFQVYLLREDVSWYGDVGDGPLAQRGVQGFGQDVDDRPGIRQQS